ncbi:hypothetical protein [Novosphingobium sp.]|uniref:hypothetical protein n=1 Tax=Novosphingobium sp. TaxID=1874826 RepID=UPI0035B33829
MSFGEVMGLMVVVGGMIAVFGMITEAYKARLRVKEREYEAMIARGPARSADAEETERLEARVRVLERIATDKGQDLARQIEQLREPAAN